MFKLQTSDTCTDASGSPPLQLFPIVSCRICHSLGLLQLAGSCDPFSPHWVAPDDDAAAAAAGLRTLCWCEDACIYVRMVTVKVDTRGSPEGKQGSRQKHLKTDIDPVGSGFRSGCRMLTLTAKDKHNKGPKRRKHQPQYHCLVNLFWQRQSVGHE